MDNSAMYGVSVRDFGAVGDGAADDRAAIQRALDSGRERVTIPLGSYRIGGALRIGSHTRLVVHPEARIVLANGAGTGPDVHLITNRNPGSGDVDISVEGGIWDGNNPANPRGPDRPDSYTGVAVSFINVRGLHLRSLRIVDPESFYVRVGQVRQFRIEDIVMEAKHLRPNQDGIHVGGHSEDGVIRNIRGFGRGTPNDDVIALNADDATFRALNLGMVCGPIRRVRVEHVAADDCHTFVRLGSIWSTIEDIEIRDVRGGCQMNAVNADALRYCRVPLFDRLDPRFAGGVGLLRNVRLSHFAVHKSAPAGDTALLRLETRMENFCVEDFRRVQDRDALPTTPTLCMKEVVTDGVVLEGLSAEAADDVQQRSSATVRARSLLAAMSGPPAYRVEMGLAQGQVLESFCEALPRLHVDGCRMTPIPVYARTGQG